MFSFTPIYFDRNLEGGNIRVHECEVVGSQRHTRCIGALVEKLYSSSIPMHLAGRPKHPIASLTLG